MGDGTGRATAALASGLVGWRDPQKTTGSRPVGHDPTVHGPIIRQVYSGAQRVHVVHGPGAWTWCMDLVHGAIIRQVNQPHSDA